MKLKLIYTTKVQPRSILKNISANNNEILIVELVLDNLINEILDLPTDNSTGKFKIKMFEHAKISLNSNMFCGIYK